MKNYGETIQIMTTYSCNMSCPKCIQRPYSLEKGYMEWSEFENALSSLIKTPPKKIIISGGEPTLWPYLLKAIESIKANLNSEIEVISNGIGKDGGDYGRADLISISNYGSINKLDILRLKRQLGRRMRILGSCQVPVPIECNGGTLPAVCNCYNPTFVRGNVYRCPVAGYNRLGAVPAGEYSEKYLKHNERLLFNDEICRNCIANFNARKVHNEEVVFEISGWNTRLCYLIPLGGLSRVARGIYRKVQGLR